MDPEDRIVRITTHPAMVWVIRNVASHIDPLLFRATGGRLTVFGPPTLPMLTLTTVGRKSGKPRRVHLACVEHAGHPLVVASAMGQEKHPAWSLNLEANPDVEVQARGERYAARAERLSNPEKQTVWPKIKSAIPQMNVYETRTSRNIRIYRVIRGDGPD